MKKIVVVFSITAALIAAALIIPVFAAKEKNAVTPAMTPAAVTPTATPVAQPTTAPTPSVPMPSAMTAEEFFKKIMLRREIRQGDSVVITGAVADKEKGNVIFRVPWDDFVRGGMSFGIYVQLSDNDFAKIKIGETITVEANVLTFASTSGGYAILSDSRVLR